MDLQSEKEHTDTRQTPSDPWTSSVDSMSWEICSSLFLRPHPSQHSHYDISPKFNSLVYEGIGRSWMESKKSSNLILRPQIAK